MGAFICNTCGGNLIFKPGDKIGECDHCGRKWPLRHMYNEHYEGLYERAKTYFRNNDFDIAAAIFEQILIEDPNDAEIYWSLVLCRYGIEYVTDPETNKRIPTVNRTQFESIFEDDNYKSVMKFADSNQRIIYETEAKTIDDIQAGILSVSQKESPFDVFICYKETDNNNKRTIDSMIAEDLYVQLNEKGIKVFFSHITLKEKLGIAYEPYIFAALNSAKVMIVLGTSPEHFNAVWVKNEWKRYLELVKKSNNNKRLIPAFRDMKPEDLPSELSRLQAHDIHEDPLLQNLIRTILKDLGKSETKPMARESVIVNTHSVNIEALLKRMFMSLEDGNWMEADKFCEMVLNNEPENAEAYLGKLMCDLKIRNLNHLADCAEPFDDNKNYEKIIQFGDSELQNEISGYITHIKERNENERLTRIYDKAVSDMKTANTESAFKATAEIFESIPSFKNAAILANQCIISAEACRKDVIYDYARSQMHGEAIHRYETAIKNFNEISSWKNTDELIQVCQRKIKEIKKRKITVSILKTTIFLCALCFILLTKIIIPNNKYNKALALYNSGNYSEAINAFTALKGYKYSERLIAECDIAIKKSKYNAALDLYNSGQYSEAITLFTDLNGYNDSSEKIDECMFLIQKKVLSNTEVGATIKFGYYEQDNMDSDGKDEIEWLVLAKDGNNALIISKYVLDCQNFNDTDTDTTWKKSSLRSWLNDTFYNKAFSISHQNMISFSNITTETELADNSSPQYNTNDKIFLLSITEVNKYLATEDARKCAPTDYAISQGAYPSAGNNDKIDGKSTCWWWLRSPDEFSKGASYVDYGGTIKNSVHSGCEGVRPAMWINLGD